MSNVLNKPLLDIAELKAGRAIAGVMINRYFFRFFVILNLLSVTVLVLSITLTLVHSVWWLIIVILFLLSTLLLFLVTLLVRFVSQKITPRKLTKQERGQISSFVDEFGIKYAAAKSIKRSPLALSGLIAWRYAKKHGEQSVHEVLTEPMRDVQHLKASFRSITSLFD